MKNHSYPKLLFCHWQERTCLQSLSGTCLHNSLHIQCPYCNIPFANSGKCKSIICHYEKIHIPLSTHVTENTHQNYGHAIHSQELEKIKVYFHLHPPFLDEIPSLFIPKLCGHLSLHTAQDSWKWKKLKFWLKLTIQACHVTCSNGMNFFYIYTDLYNKTKHSEMVLITNRMSRGEILQ